MSSPAKIVVHHLDQSRSERILWLLEEIGVPYEVQKHQRDEKTRLAPAELRQFHPLGRAPIVSHGKITLAESGAIIEFLIDTYAPYLRPADGEALQQYRYWLHFAEGTLMPPMVAKLILNSAREKAGVLFLKPLVNKLIDGIMDAYYGPNLTQNLAFIDEHLTHNTWFAGDTLSGADFQMCFPLQVIRDQTDAEQYPSIHRFVERVHAQATFQKARQHINSQ